MIHSLRSARSRAFGRMAAGLVFAAASLAPSSHAATFALLKDTIDLRSNQNPPAANFITNAAADSLVFDSVSIRHVAANPPPFQLVFFLQSGASPNYTLNRQFFASGGPGFSSQFQEPTRFSVRAQTTAVITGAGFDECIYCPTAKRAASEAVSAIGDTLKAWVRFHSGPNKDSVFFLSKIRNSTALLPGRPPGLPAFAPLRRVDLAGRALREPARFFLLAPAAR